MSRNINKFLIPYSLRSCTQLSQIHVCFFFVFFIKDYKKLRNKKKNENESNAKEILLLLRLKITIA